MKIKIILFTIVGFVIVGLIMKNFVPTKQSEQKVTQEGPTPTIEPRVASDDRAKKSYMESTQQGIQVYIQRYDKVPESFQDLEAVNLGGPYDIVNETKVYPDWQDLPDQSEACVISMTLSTGEVLKAYCNPTIK